MFETLLIAYIASSYYFGRAYIFIGGVSVAFILEAFSVLTFGAEIIGVALVIGWIYWFLKAVSGKNAIKLFIFVSIGTSLYVLGRTAVYILALKSLNMLSIFNFFIRAGISMLDYCMILIVFMTFYLLSMRIFRVEAFKE